MEMNSREAVYRHLTCGLAVFFFHPIRAWEYGVISNIETDCAKPVVTVRCKSGETLDIAADAASLFLPVSNSVDFLSDDLLQLPELHNALLLHVLRNRYAKDLTYVYVGEMILSVNPFKVIPTYQDKHMGAYLDYLDEAQLPASLTPHVWCVAHRAYVEMRAKQANYSIIASGESGSGKTKACKMMLEYLCAASERVATHTFVSKRLQRISKNVQLCSTILESFGNAKTVKNDNSSRFGKFMEVQFDSGGIMVGLRVTPFLLERSRVVTCGTDERVFHAFYQLLAGASPVLRDMLRLTHVRDFVLLCKGNCVSLKGCGVDDAKDFQRLQTALSSLGFSDDDQNVLWSVIATILHLQNIVFEERRVDNAAYMSDGDMELANFVAAQLLQLPHPHTFVENLTTNTVVVGGETVTRKLSGQMARDQRDSICKYLYTKLFLFVVHRNNAATAAGADFGEPQTDEDEMQQINVISSKPTTWIALLDIFGFEDFHMNSLEQFCINLANESLQRQYTERMFELDMEEMRAEGVEPKSTEFVDNLFCLTLLQGSKNSIISYLDDASMLDMVRSQTNPDFVFLNSITSAFRPDYQTAPGKVNRSVLNRNEKMDNPAAFFYRGRLDDNNFTIRHYAGDVKYCINGFVEKNNDFVKDSCAQVLQTTNSWTHREMMATTEEMVGLLGDDGVLSPPVSSARISKRTVASTFRASLQLLMEMLNGTTCNWVRCIRPHSRRQPGMFDGKLVLEQLVATGVLSTITQRQRNYPFRMYCDNFARQYHVLLQPRWSLRPATEARDKCIAILSAARVDTQTAQVGLSRVFLTMEGQKNIELIRSERTNMLVLVISQFTMAFLSRAYVRFLLVNRHVVRMQRIYRLTLSIRRCVQCYYAELRRRRQERFLMAVKELIRLESVTRVNLTSEQDTYVRSTWREFRSRLAPLVADVLRNVRVVEANRREAIGSEADGHFQGFRAAFARGADAARARERQRLERQREKDARAREELSTAAIDALLLVVREEAAAFAVLRDEVIGPAVREIRKAAARIRRWRRWREERLGELQRAREVELLRLAADEAVAIQREENRWRRVVGQQQYIEELRYFQRFANTPLQAGTTTATTAMTTPPPPLRALLRDGVPSEILRTPLLPIGAVTSFKDYRDFMRNEFRRACVDGTAPTCCVPQGHNGSHCEVCAASPHPLQLISTDSLSVSHNRQQAVVRRLYDNENMSDDSFDEMNFE